jgi:hypothetical protein
MSKMNPLDLFEDRERRRLERARSRLPQERSADDLSSAARLCLKQVYERNHPLLMQAVREGWTTIAEAGELVRASDDALDAVFKDFERSRPSIRAKRIQYSIGVLKDVLRKRPGPCERCGGPIHGFHVKRYCSDSCRQAAYRKRRAPYGGLVVHSE